MVKARVAFKSPPTSSAAFTKLATSDALAEALERIAQPVFENAKQDPNAKYVSTLRMRRHISQGRRSRVSIRIGGAPFFGYRVEAKRGTLARALTNAGL